MNFSPLHEIGLTPLVLSGNKIKAIDRRQNDVPWGISIKDSMVVKGRELGSPAGLASDL